MSGPYETALGGCYVGQAILEVIEVSGEWLVRTRVLGEQPSNHQRFQSREAANDFAAELHSITAEMMERVVGSPADLRLAEVSDDAT